MKALITLLFFCSIYFVQSQTLYKNPLGFNVRFDKTWKRLPKEVLQEKTKFIKEYMEYKKNIQYDACYQKIGNADMDYPYILFKNFYATTTNENEIEKLREFYTDKFVLDKIIESIETDKVKMKLQIGKTYFDKKKQLLIFTYDLNLNVKGNLVALVGFYVGKSATLQILCYTYLDEFKYDQKEFLDIINSIEDNGMKTNMSDYLKNHDQAVIYYNEGLSQSSNRNIVKAIEYYSLAINTYPTEDRFQLSEAYYNRALNKRKLDNFTGAIADYTKAIEFRSDYYKAYNNRGFAYLMLEKYSTAIYDFTMAIKFDNYQTEFTGMALGNRGIAKLSIGEDGCEDLKKAIAEGNLNVKSIFYEYCN